MNDPFERPPISGSPLSLVLVARNAAADLDVVLADWVRLLDGLGRDHEILLVDDGSTDETPARADALAGQYPRLRVFHQALRRGFGAALRTGIGAAQYP